MTPENILLQSVDGKILNDIQKHVKERITLHAYKRFFPKNLEYSAKTKKGTLNLRANEHFIDFIQLSINISRIFMFLLSNYLTWHLNVDDRQTSINLDDFKIIQK